MTQIKDIQGFVTCADIFMPLPATVTARYTSDKMGKTLSFEANGVMITVAYEEIARLIKKCEKGSKDE